MYGTQNLKPSLSHLLLHFNPPWLRSSNRPYSSIMYFLFFCIMNECVLQLILIQQIFNILNTYYVKLKHVLDIRILIQFPNRLQTIWKRKANLFICTHLCCFSQMLSQRIFVLRVYFLNFCKKIMERVKHYSRNKIVTRRMLQLMMYNVHTFTQT